MVAAPSAPKNVVIIGASASGAALARALEATLPSTHRLVLIDRQDFAFWPIASLRAAVVPGWEDKVFKSIDDFFPASSRHVILPGTSVSELGEGFVSVEGSNHASKGFSDTINFDICVLALGSTYSFPMRPASNSISDAKQAFREIQTEVKDAKRIVVVGGGTCGIEFAGEISSHYKDKEVTLVHSYERLLSASYPAGLSKRLLDGLKKLDVKILLKERVPREVLEAGKGVIPFSDGSVINADLVINATGITINNGLVKAIDPVAITKDGRISVDGNLRVISSNSASPLARSTYFAIGDAAASKAAPTAIKAGADAGSACKNILATIANKPLTAAAAPLNIIVIPIGPSGGAFMLPFMTLGGWAASAIKGKTLLLANFDKTYGSK